MTDIRELEENWNRLYPTDRFGGDKKWTFDFQGETIIVRLVEQSAFDIRGKQDTMFMLSALKTVEASHKSFIQKKDAHLLDLGYVQYEVQNIEYEGGEPCLFEVAFPYPGELFDEKVYRLYKDILLQYLAKKTHSSWTVKNLLNSKSTLIIRRS